MKDRLYSLREKWLLGILFLASIASLFFFIHYRTLAFPEHTIKFSISRDEAIKMSSQFVASQHVDPNAYKKATIFSSDSQSKTYLEREVGVAQTAKLAVNQIDLWHFTTRYFQPLKKEEVSVSYLPNGRFVGFSHDIEEGAKGAKLSKDAAQKLAEQFVSIDAQQPIREWKLVSGESTQRPNRVDHTFVWEKKNFKAKDATYRIQVIVQGDQIGGYAEYLKIPESWLRQYDNDTSQNTLAQTIDESIALILFGISLFVTFIIGFKNSNLRLRFSRKVALAAAVVALLTSLNSLPLDFFSYDTITSWNAFIGGLLYSSLVDSLSQGVMVLIIFAAGETAYRAMFPQKVSLEAVFGKAFGTKQANKAIFIGTFVGIIFFSYEIAYYFLGKQFGFWSPADINYDDIFSTAIPWVYPMFIGFIAATTEEGIFRLFGISFLKKYVKKTWIAVLITSLCWAFLHSNYPQSPWFVRGIELSVVGIVFGTIYVRYGILASLTAHYTFNALQTAIYFSSSSNLYSIISSTIVSLLPFLIAVMFLLRSVQKNGFLAETKEFINVSLTNSVPKITTVVKEKMIPAMTYKPFSKKRILIICLLSVISVIGFWKYDDVVTVGQSPVATDRQDAIVIAEKQLTAKGIQFKDYYHVVTFNSNEDTQAEEYILEKADVAKVNQIFPAKVPTDYWSVRFFKPLQKEEYEVDILSDGRVYQLDHTVDEKAKGANLKQDEALKIAQTYLTQSKKYDLSQYKVVENTADKKENRTDYYFEFEAKKKLVGDALYRTAITIRGNEVAGFSQYIKLPEAWLREKSQTSTLEFIVGAISGITGLLIFSLGFGTFLKFTREKRIRFKIAFFVAAIATIFSAGGIINSLPTFFNAYETSIPINSFIIQRMLVSLLGMVVSFFAMALAVGQFGAMWRYVFGGFFPQEKSERSAYIRDSIIAAYLVPFLLSGISIVLVYLSISRDSLQTVSNYNSLSGLDTYVPFLSTVLPLPAILIVTAFTGSIILLVYKYLKKWKYVSFFFIFFIILSALPQQKGVTDFALSVFESLLVFGGLVLIVAFVLRKNLLAYGLLVYITLLLASGLGFVEQEKQFYILNGAILLVLAFLPLIVYLLRKYILQLLRVWFRLKLS